MKTNEAKRTGAAARPQRQVPFERAARHSHGLVEADAGHVGEELDGRLRTRNNKTARL